MKRRKSTLLVLHALCANSAGRADVLNMLGM